MKNILDAPEKKAPSDFLYKRWAFYFFLAYYALGLGLQLFLTTNLVTDISIIYKTQYVFSLFRNGILIFGIAFLVFSHLHYEKKDFYFFVPLIGFSFVILFQGIFSHVMNL